MVLNTGCLSPPPTRNLVRRSQPLLGTFVNISVYALDAKDAAEAAISDAFAEIKRIDSLMSLHRGDSELVALNATAYDRWVTVSPDLFQVIAKAQSIACATAGSFDITIRPIVDLWGFIWKEYRLPTPGELESALPLVDYRLVELDPVGCRVRFSRAGVSLDLGGIAKGFAVDCAIEKLRSRGVTAAMVRAGGDLRVLGAPPGRRGWVVQLEDPDQAGKRRRITLRDEAVSTSGNYENFFMIAGTRYAHILDPRTGLPVRGVAACSVIAGTCMESDAWATALFVLGREEAFGRFNTKIPFLLTEEATSSSRSRTRASRAWRDRRR